jgi:tetratricopeptide (TPR) repeat protein
MPAFQDRNSGAWVRVLTLACAVALGASGCGKSADEKLAEAEKLQETEQVDASLVLVREVLAESPDDPRANYLLGLGLVRRGERTSAVFPLRRAASSDAFAVDAGVMLARLLAATQNFEEAETAAAGVLAKEPENADALGIRAQTRIGLSRWDDAIADLDHLLRIAPNDAKIHLAKAGALDSAKRFDEAGQALARSEELERENGDLTAASAACSHQANVLRRADAAIERVTAQLEKCLAEYPTQVAVLRPLAQIYSTSGKPDKAIDAWRKAVAEAPESLELRLALADQLLTAGKSDEALKEARQAADDFGSVQAWIGVSNIERRNGNLDATDAALERAAELASDPEPIRYLRADLLVDRGKLEEAEALAATLNDPAHGALLNGRVLLERGDAQGALDSLEKGLERYPAHARSRAEAGRAAQELGLFDRALGHYRESVRAGAAETHAGLAGAALAYSLGRYDDAVALAGAHIAAHPQEGPDAFRIAIRSAHAAGLKNAVAGMFKALDQRGEKGLALAEKARIQSEEGGPAAAAAVFENASIDLSAPENEGALRALVDADVAQGRSKEGLATLDRAIRSAPRAALHDLRARVLLSLGRTEEARKDFDKALAADPAYGPAHAGLGVLAFGAGDLDGALREFDAATAAKTPDVEAGYRATQVLRAQGKKEEAEKRLRAFVARVPDHAGANNDLAWLLAERSAELPYAAELAGRAVRWDPSPATYDTLAWVEIKQGNPNGAIATLATGLGAAPKSSMLLFRLGLAKKAAGDKAGALDAFRGALEDGAFADRGAAQAEIASLEKGEKP